MTPTRFRPTSVPTFGIFTPAVTQARPPMPPKIAQAQRRLQRNGSRAQATARPQLPSRFQAQPEQTTRIRAEDIAPKRREPSLAQLIERQNELLEHQNELLEAQHPVLLEILAHVNGGKSFAESQIDESPEIEVTETTIAVGTESESPSPASDDAS